MREKTNSRTRRSLRMYRRLRHSQEGVSPVVATLILILIAVAAAAALYLWLINFQKGATNNIGNGGVQPTLSVGGSTTVFPLSELAIKWFEANNSNIKVADQQGGSIAGVLAVCSGQLDIGASSSALTAGQLAACPKAVQTVVGLDALPIIVSSTNAVPADVAAKYAASAHTVIMTGGQVFSFNASSILAIYVAAGDSGLVSNYHPNVAGYALPAWLPAPAGSGFTWNQIPFPAGCSSLTGAAEPCVVTTASTATIKAYDRGDNSGTEQGFTQKVLGIPKDASGNSCGTDNQLVSCGIQVNHATGNPALLSAVQADPSGIGFNGLGFADAAGSAIVKAAYLGSGQTIPQIPTTTNTLAAFHGMTGNSIYAPWRPLEYVTVGAPTGEAAAYINFVTGSQVNQDLCSVTGYVSLYAS